MKKSKNIILNLISIVCVAVLLWSALHLVVYLLNWQKTNSEIENINKYVETKTNTSDSQGSGLLDIDFESLRKINSDVKGWIKVNGTKINYPFVQTSDNSFYLDHSFDKSKNKNGWIFLDYRNDLNNQNQKNYILYAHNMKNQTMFGTLKNTMTQDWLDNSDNFTIYTYTENECTLWQVFSVYNTSNLSEYLKIDFPSDEEYQRFLNSIKSKSVFNFNVDLDSSDKILTLSTCYGSNSRTVLHAKFLSSKPTK